MLDVELVPEAVELDPNVVELVPVTVELELIVVLFCPPVVALPAGDVAFHELDGLGFGGSLRFA